MPHRAATGWIRRLPNSNRGPSHSFPVCEYILPCSYKDQLLPDNLLDSGTDIVHALYPYHWVAGFQSLCDTLGCLHLINYPLQPVLCLFIQISQECPQLAGLEQTVVLNRLVFSQILPVHPSPFADGAGFFRQH